MRRQSQIATPTEKSCAHAITVVMVEVVATVPASTNATKYANTAFKMSWLM